LRNFLIDWRKEAPDSSSSRL